MLYANVIVDISHEKLDQAFQYRVPADLEKELKAGMRVNIPFGSRTITGYVMEITDHPSIDAAKIKPLLSIVPGAVAIESQLIALAAWMREHYGGTMNQALKTVLPVKKEGRRKERKQVSLLLPEQQARDLYETCIRRHHTARARLLEELIECSPQPYAHLTKDIGIAPAVMHSLEEKGVILIEKEFYYRNPASGHAWPTGRQDGPVQLNEAQSRVVDSIIHDFAAGERRTYLLHGVTGSGKTEVYMELIAYAQAQGRQCIVLIPEIALTFQTMSRFYRRFGDKVSILHSRLSPAERYDQFERAKNGDIDIMIGPRSALFSPFPNLGFIIIDEEHENSYKSEITPKYHARDTAIARAGMAGASVVLGSATPSVDSYYLAQQGKYCLLCLEQRVEERPLPVCETVDLRSELRAGNRSVFSVRLQQLIEDRLAKKQQVMLFLNRRGVAGFVSCRSCGNVLHCPHCDVSLSQHKNGRLVCHYCGYETPMVSQCPSCGSKFIGGFKAGTQKIQELVAARFPQARVLRMDYDTTRTKDSYEQILSAFASQKADILVGTQMIVKGHDFPNVTLVGILAADMSLNISDFHASERTFQLITQAAGRAGRGGEPGTVIIQTYQPDHFSIRAASAQDYEAFYMEEIMYRKLMRYPPVWNMLHVMASSANKEEAEACMEQISLWLQRELKKAGDDALWRKLLVVGPTDPAISKINDIYRKALYMKHPSYEILIKVKNFLEKQLKEQAPRWKKVSVQFDFHP